MPKLNSPCIHHSESQEGSYTFDEDFLPEQPVSIEQHPSSFTCSVCSICLLLLMTIEPNKVVADQPNFDSHSNQDVLDFSAHRPTKKKNPFPPGEPVPPPPPGGRQHIKSPKDPPSLLLLAHRMEPDHKFCIGDFGTISGFGFTKPFPLAPQQNLGSSSVIPSPSSLFLFLLAARHRRRRMTYGVRPSHGRFHHHFVRSPLGPNNQSRGIP